jgi:uncharacterized protein (DUF927 family)
MTGTTYLPLRNSSLGENSIGLLTQSLFGAYKLVKLLNSSFANTPNLVKKKKKRTNLSIITSEYKISRYTYKLGGRLMNRVSFLLSSVQNFDQNFYYTIR